MSNEHFLRGCFLCDRSSYIGWHGKVGVRQNDFAGTPMHVILVAAEHRDYLDNTEIADTLDFAQCHPEYFVFHNRLGSGASQFHAHGQGIMSEEPLLIETLAREPFLTMTDGTSICRVSKLPTYAVAIRGPGVLPVSFAVIDQLDTTPFNLVFRNAEIVIVPRTKERPENFRDNFAGLEVSGCLICTDEERYRSVQFEEIVSALAECGFGSAQRREFEDALIRRFAR